MELRYTAAVLFHIVLYCNVQLRTLLLLLLLLFPPYRLVGLVVKASASRAEDPGFESRLRRDFFGVESYQ